MTDIVRPDIKPAFDERNIPVAFSTDANYLPYVGVAVNSVVANASGGNLDFLILHSGIDDEAIGDFIARYAGRENVSVRFIDASEAQGASALADFKQVGRLPVSACYRLLLSDILPAYDKVVYLDVDVAVCRDLGELYATDLGDSYFAAAKDIVHSTKPEYLEWAARWGFTEWDGYVNTGVLVMNLDRFRREPVRDRLLAVAVEASRWFCGQDAFNFVCKGWIAPLDLRWNVQLGDYCIEEQLALTGDEIWIAHFAGPQKPWKYPARRYPHLWWKHVGDLDFAVALWRKAFDVGDAAVCLGEGVAVSVIVPVYNAEPWLVQSLVSLAAQTLRNIEVICVDDGSTDGSGAICERFAAADSRFRVLHQTNSGGAVARNRGIEEAKGRWLFFADADDFCRPDMLAKMVERGDTMDAEVVVAGRFVIDNRQPKAPCLEVSLPKCFSEADSVVDRTSHGLNVFAGPGFAPWNKLYRACFVRRTGLRFHQTPPTDDVFFVLATLLTAKRIALVPAAYYYYRSFIQTSQMGQADKHPTNFIVALRELHEVVATCEEKTQREYYSAAVASCFVNLMLRKTKVGRDATYAALCDGGLDALRLPLADEHNVDLGIYRELMEMTKARADVVEVIKKFCMRRQLRAEAEKDRLRSVNEQNRLEIEKLQNLVNVHLGRISVIADRVRQKDARIAELQEQIRQLRQDHAAAILAKDARIAELLDRMRRVPELQEQMRQLRQDRAAVVSAKDARIATLLAQGQEYRQKIARLMQIDASTKRVKDENDKLHKENRELRCAIQELDREKRHLSTVLADIGKAVDKGCRT